MVLKQIQPLNQRCARKPVFHILECGDDGFNLKKSSGPEMLAVVRPSENIKYITWISLNSHKAINEYQLDEWCGTGGGHTKKSYST